ncbi:MAG: NAD(P)H-dependent glycerol-3-phosphate dehydrogenase [Brevinema sp.]
MSYNTVVLGAGSWGTALSIVLAQNNNVTLWNASSDTLNDIKNNKENTKYLPGVIVDNITLEDDLRKAVENKDIIVIVIPSKYCRSVLQQLASYATNKQIIVSATKGLELSPLRTMTDLIQELLPHKKSVVALSGPSHAEETGRKLYTCLVASSYDQEAAQIVQQCFSTSWTRIYTNDDPIGVEIGAAIKNVIAIAAGIVSATNLGDNTLAALVTRGIAEMTRFGIAVGGKTTTFSGLTGVGDLIVTCYSQHSRNRYVGQQIALGKKVTEIENSMVQVPEGVRAVQQIYQYAQENNIAVPIVESVYHILYQNLSLEDWKQMLTARPLTNEDNF